ncbi:MAG: ATP-dependent Clp protease ATP-binding subunit [Bacteriovoracaceae bacterium]|nr:ATP-dependent Clp protease ATP-binding subunit [Bacteriovoracaceae bacterium]
MTLEKTSVYRERLCAVALEDIDILNRKCHFLPESSMHDLESDIDKLLRANISQKFKIFLTNPSNQSETWLEKTYQVATKEERIETLPYSVEYDLPNNCEFDINAFFTSSFSSLRAEHQKGVIKSLNLSLFDSSRLSSVFNGLSMTGKELVEPMPASEPEIPVNKGLLNCFLTSKRSFFISSYVDSRKRVQEFVAVANKLKRTPVLWTFADGLQVLDDPGTKVKYVYHDQYLTHTRMHARQLISYIKNEGKRDTLYLLEDFHYYLAKDHFKGPEFAELISQIKSLAPSLKELGSVVVILSPKTDLPQEIAPIFEVIKGNKADDKFVFLEKYGTDFTKLIQENKMKPVVGRDEEITQCLKILSKMETNNPLLIGNAGVGKTAIVEGLAARIAEGRVPKYFMGKKIISLNLNALISDTKYRGEFESRLEEILEEVRGNADKIIIFIDEIHTLLGLGSTEGSAGASNVLKPVLARGEFPCIGATTGAEYDRYIRQDKALSRRFQVVEVEEPDEWEAYQMLQGVTEVFEKHHGVRISDDALRVCVKLSSQLIEDQCFPGKAIKMLDAICASAVFEDIRDIDSDFVTYEFYKLKEN